MPFTLHAGPQIGSMPKMSTSKHSDLSRKQKMDRIDQERLMQRIKNQQAKHNRDAMRFKDNEASKAEAVAVALRNKL